MHWALIRSPFFNFHFIMHFLNFFLFLPVFFTFFAARTCFFLFPLTPIVVVYSSWGSVFLKVSSFYRAALLSFLNMAHRGPSDNVASSSVLPGFSWLKIVIWGGTRTVDDWSAHQWVCVTWGTYFSVHQVGWQQQPISLLQLRRKNGERSFWVSFYVFS